MNGQCLPHVALAVAYLAATQACDGSSTAERALGHADAEVFEVVARSQRDFGVETSSRSPRFLRIDRRPIDSPTQLPPQSPMTTGIALDADSVEPSSRAVERIVRERRAILKRLGVEEGRRAEPLSFDTSEVWTVLVTETSIGTGGQDWRQYAWVLTRQPGHTDLSLATRFLLSRAE